MVPSWVLKCLQRNFEWEKDQDREKANALNYQEQLSIAEHCACHTFVPLIPTLFTRRFIASFLR